MEITVRKVLKYSLLPGIVPRTKDFFTSGFSYVSLFMALAFRAADLLPANHPYLISTNFGRFGIRQVLAEARRNLVFRRENTDQIVIYYTIQLGIFLIFMEFVMLALSLTAHTAHAGTFGAWVGQFFGTTAMGPSGDVAFILLDHV